MGASVKVMRSYDYCHFEVCLSDDDATTDEQVDQLRKRAARLADKAVTQYQTAKAWASGLYNRKAELEHLRKEVAVIQNVPEAERTEMQKAKVKLLADRDWDAYINRDYDYEDDWDRSDE